jgi:hypothetical protein
MKIELEDYTVIQEDNPWVFKALRHGLEWRNLVGDNLVLALCYKIEDLENEVKKYNELKEKLKEVSNTAKNFTKPTKRPMVINEKETVPFNVTDGIKTLKEISEYLEKRSL